MIAHSAGVWCTRCGLEGHEVRPSVDDRYPLVRCGRSLVAGARDADQGAAIAAAHRLELERRKAARTGAPA